MFQQPRPQGFSLKKWVGRKRETREKPWGRGWCSNTTAEASRDDENSQRTAIQSIFLMAQWTPSLTISPGICHLVGPGGGDLSGLGLPRGGGICQFFLTRLKSFLFNVSVKIYPYLDSFIENICNTYALKRYVWFSLQHFHFLYPSKKLLPPILISSNMEEKSTSSK